MLISVTMRRTGRKKVKIERKKITPREKEKITSPPLIKREKSKPCRFYFYFIICCKNSVRKFMSYSNYSEDNYPI